MLQNQIEITTTEIGQVILTTFLEQFQRFQRVVGTRPQHKDDARWWVQRQKGKVTLPTGILFQLVQPIDKDDFLLLLLDDLIQHSWQIVAERRAAVGGHVDCRQVVLEAEPSHQVT